MVWKVTEFSVTFIMFFDGLDAALIKSIVTGAAGPSDVNAQLEALLYLIWLYFC